MADSGTPAHVLGYLRQGKKKKEQLSTFHRAKWKNKLPVTPSREITRKTALLGAKWTDRYIKDIRRQVERKNITLKLTYCNILLKKSHHHRENIQSALHGVAHRLINLHSPPLFVFGGLHRSSSISIFHHMLSVLHC
ncbi:hypothetical protein CEXT_63531 [Caerostris extrusa]|uniref:Uncharacterized protein n=1 Tax=Caerostris extrusa TaxID=172846 RepID=A0AAV4TGG8_CAEEX|nr:hypothetical protein CEXT_63531 [Caerostris extrusa]